MKITAFKSEYTGEIFTTQKEYNLHLKEYKQNLETNEEKEELKSKEQELMHMPRLTAISIEDFRQKMFNVVNELNGNNPDKLLGLFFNDLYFGFVSNTHSNPIDGISNWGNEPDKPTGYDGWKGQVTIIFSQEDNVDENRDKIERIVNHFPAFNSGIGGYRGKEYNGINGYVLQYELKLYIDDFPLLKEQYEKFKSIKIEFERWKENIYKMVDDRNKSDKVIINYNKNIEDYTTKINTLKEELSGIESLKYNKCNQNKDLILSENKFKELEKINEIGKILLLKLFYVPLY